MPGMVSAPIDRDWKPSTHQLLIMISLAVISFIALGFGCEERATERSTEEIELKAHINAAQERYPSLIYIYTWIDIDPSIGVIAYQKSHST
jgi:hypothetical protein